MNKPSFPVLLFKDQQQWASWLEAHHASSPGIWMQIAKKSSGLTSVSYVEALEEALCYGWIDGQKKSHDESSWLQKFTPRGPKSVWSKINREKAQELVKLKRMKAAGLKAIEAAKQNGCWDSAYDGQSKASVPPDLQAALRKNARARAFFETLNSANRYAILYRLQTAKKAETRQKRLEQFVRMLENHEKIHP